MSQKQLTTIYWKNIKCFREIQPVRGGLYGKAGDLIILDRDVEKYAFQVSESMETGEELPGYTIPLLMKKFDLPEIDILKMDIEGSEFSVFTNNPEEWLPVSGWLLQRYMNTCIRELGIRLWGYCKNRVSLSDGKVRI